MTGATRRVQRDEFWKDNAKCVERWDLFFGPDDAAVSPEQEYEARALCRTCLVASDCAVYAELHRERYGIWSGVNREPKRNGSKALQVHAS